MKKFLILLAAPVLLFLFSCSYAQEKADPALAAQDEARYTWNFGKVKKDETLKHTFSLANDSNATLNIKNVQTSCGCTAVEIKNKVLLPGETTELEVKVEVKGYAGEVKQYVFVYTDNLDNPVLRFIIKAEVTE